jgi:uncharacterized protein YgiM (DUF1202 family)
MAKKLDLHELLELLPAISEIWDDATAISKKAAKRVTKEAKNPAYGWAAVGIAVAVTAVIAYSMMKPEEEDRWNEVSASPDA